MSALAPKADMCGATRYVRFTPESGHSQVSLKSGAFEQLKEELPDGRAQIFQLPARGCLSDGFCHHLVSRFGQFTSRTELRGFAFVYMSGASSSETPVAITLLSRP